MGPRPAHPRRRGRTGAFIGLTVLGATVDPVFARFAILLSIIAASSSCSRSSGRSSRPSRRCCWADRGRRAGPRGRAALPASSRSRTICSSRRSRATRSTSTRPIVIALSSAERSSGCLGRSWRCRHGRGFRDVFRYLFRRASDGRSPDAREASDLAILRTRPVSRRPVAIRPSRRSPEIAVCHRRRQRRQGATDVEATPDPDSQPTRTRCSR